MWSRRRLPTLISTALSSPQTLRKLPVFPPKPLGSDECLELTRHRLQTREPRFLESMRRLVYAIPTRPDMRLLPPAGRGGWAPCPTAAVGPGAAGGPCPSRLKTSPNETRPPDSGLWRRSGHQPCFRSSGAADSPSAGYFTGYRSPGCGGRPSGGSPPLLPSTPTEGRPPPSSLPQGSWRVGGGGGSPPRSSSR